MTIYWHKLWYNFQVVTPSSGERAVFFFFFSKRSVFWNRYRFRIVIHTVDALHTRLCNFTPSDSFLYSSLCKSKNSILYSACNTTSVTIRFSRRSKGQRSNSSLKTQFSSLIPRPLPDFISHPWLRDKIWEGPGHEATIFHVHGFAKLTVDYIL